jgi:hypothetical protein
MGVLKRHGSLIAEDEGRIVTINCGGVKHQTLIHTLRKFPGTLLADLAKGPEKDFPGGALYTKGEVCDLCSGHVLVTMCLLQSILFIITHVFARGWLVASVLHPNKALIYACINLQPLDWCFVFADFHRPEHNSIRVYHQFLQDRPSFPAITHSRRAVEQRMHLFQNPEPKDEDPDGWRNRQYRV